MDRGMILPALLLVFGLVGIAIGITMATTHTGGQYLSCPSGYSVMMQRLPNGHLDVSCG
jgi:hypothetical protein